MQYYSLNKTTPVVDFKTATIQGQAPDKGLYFPAQIPQHSFIDSIDKMSDADICFRAIAPFVGDCITEEQLFKIVSETISFPLPLQPINEKISSLELFHGPTLAFKDIGARFMSRCLAEFCNHEKKKITVLVATSGDTGGAVASGFYKVANVEVIILYPSGKVSPVQEKQLTTLGHNIHALEIQGSFDDCQLMVKQAFADNDLQDNYFLTSANSINIARWLPQQFYYFLSYKQLQDKSQAPVFSVPSGNFGNICAGIMANATGLPVQHFIAACNINDVVSDYLAGYPYQTKQAVPTLSNAMDVGNPSNFNRIMEIFKQEISGLKKIFSSNKVTDTDTITTIKNVYQRYSYLLDPHTAVGYNALEKFIAANESKNNIVLATAHPVKFPEAIQRATGKNIPIPAHLSLLMEADKKSILLEAKYTKFKEWLSNRN
jgi:threonine synthase